MTEADIIEQITAVSNLTLTGLSVFVTIFSAYVVALYFFLHQAPMTMRVAAFGLFTFAVVFLGIFAIGTADYSAALHHALEELSRTRPLSPVGRALMEGGTMSSGGINEFLRWMTLGGLGAIYLAMGHLTFLHRWKEA